MTISSPTLSKGQDYPPIPNEKEVVNSLGIIKIRLKFSDPCDTDKFESAIKITEIAIQNFARLNQRVQNAIYGIRDLLVKLSQDPEYQNKLIENRSNFTVYQRLLSLFMSALYDAVIKAPQHPIPLMNLKIPALDKPCPSPPLTLRDCVIETELAPEAEDHFMFISPDKLTNKCAISLEAPPQVDQAGRPSAQRLKADQIAIIESFFNMLVRDYYSPLVLGDKSNEMSQFHQYVMQEFSRLFPPIISDLFVKEPGTITPLHKTLICSSMRGFCNFMNIFLHQADEPSDEKLMLEICQETREILKIYSKTDANGIGESPLPEEARELLNLLTTVSIVPFVFNKVLTPLLFCTLIDIFILKESGEVTQEKEIPLDHFDGSDDVFSNEVKKLMKEAIEHVLTLGGGNALMQIVGGTLTLFIDSVGTTIQQATNRSLAEECSLTPILMLQKLLYKDGTPILLSLLNKTEDEIVAYQKEINTFIHHKIYKLIESFIPKGLAWLAKKTVDLKSFCMTLTQKLFAITQNQLLFKQLVLCLLKSTRQGLEKFVASQACVPLSQSSAQPSSSQADAADVFNGLGSFIVVDRNQLTQLIDAQESEIIKKKQIAVIESFFNSLIKEYFGPLVFGQSQERMSLIHRYAIEEFSRLFPATISHLFFQTPGNLTQMHKTLIIGSLRGFHQFIEYHNSDTKKPSIEELNIRMCKSLQDIFWTYHEISQPADSPSERAKSEQSLKMLHFLAGTWIVPFVFNKVLTPNLFCAMIEVFALRRPSLSLGETEAPLEFFDSSDQKFSNEIGTLIRQICDDFVILGKGKYLFQAFPKLLGYFSQSIGTAVQQAINRALNSECCIKPILILQELLFQDGVPILMEQMSKSDEEIAAYQVKINERIRDELYKIIQTSLPYGISWLAENTTDLKPFCETISIELFKITQNEQDYKLMFLSILESIHLGLLEMKEQHESAAK